MRRLVLVSLLFSAGCGEDGVSVDASASNFCDEIAEVACHNLYQCCTEGEIENFLNVSEPRTEAQCRQDVSRACERSSVAINDSIKAGRVTFDSERMNACLNAIVAPSGTCAAVVSELPWKDACKDTAYVGTVATGGSCFFSHDCAGAPDSFCAANQKCAAKPTAGFPCGSGCASDFYCSGGICQPKLAANAPCTSSSQCQEDLFCDFEATPEAVCTARQGGGAACTSDFACESNVCIPGLCMGTGQECYDDFGCDSRCADDGSICTSAGQCAAGTCSMTSVSCFDPTDCTGGAGDNCVFPVACIPGDCVGDPVCTSATLSVDYCTGALGQLPIPD